MQSESTRFVPGFLQTFHLGGFHCVLDPAGLVAAPQESFNDVASARALFEPHLETWRLRSEIHNDEIFSFRWSGGSVVGIDSDGKKHVNAAASVHAKATMSATATLIKASVPIHDGPPIVNFDEVIAVSRRWRDYREGRERLLVTGYWLLTELTRYFDGRSNLEIRLGVSRNVIKTLSKLTSRNDPIHGRKVSGPDDPLTSQEQEWLRVAIPRIILQLVDAEANVTPQRLTMADLPNLR